MNMELQAFNFHFPPGCTQCGSILSQITPQVLPTSLIRSYYVPSVSDVSIIQGLISSTDAAIRSLEAEFYNFQLRLSNIRAFNAFHRSLLSPIRKLPDELLSEIFCYVVCKEAIDVGIGRDPIWDLQQVCAHWRTLVQDTSVLWNNFKVGRIEVTSAALKRRILSCVHFSGKAPLSISYLPLFPRKVSLCRNVEDISNHTDRLISLSIHTDTLYNAMKDTTSAALIQRQGLAQLRSLTLNGGCHSEISSHSLLFHNATALEDVKLKRINMTDLPELKWGTKVKRFIIKYCRVEDPGIGFISLLGSMSHLEELTWIDNSVVCSPTPGELVTLPSLHTLNIMHCHESQIWPIIRVPHLTNLRIRNAYDNIDGYLDMIQKTGCAIKKLHVDSCNIRYILQIITSLRDVEEISVSKAYPDGDEMIELFRGLTWDPPKNYGTLKLLPCLRKLELHFRSETDLYNIPLVFMVMESRSSKSIDRETSIPVPLELVKLVGKVSSALYKEYDRAFSLVKGNDLGIEVEVDLQKMDGDGDGDDDDEGEEEENDENEEDDEGSDNFIEGENDEGGESIEDDEDEDENEDDSEEEVKSDDDDIWW